MLYLTTVQAIMVTYHRPRVLATCLDSFLQCTPSHVRLNIIDNSTGALQFPDHHRITIYRNTSNLGKGAAFAQHYQHIMQNNTQDHFISLDPDLELYPGWYQKLHTASINIRGIMPFGIVAPVLLEQPNDVFPKQVRMHRLGPETKPIGEYLYNLRTAGCLLYIDRKFYETCGGYKHDRLYGGDDSHLCREAARMGYFVGLAPTLRIKHLRADDEPGYVAWKARNITLVHDNVGYWDTTCL